MKKKVINKEIAYANSMKLLYECSTPKGFLASSEKKDNYKRIWARDSMIVSLAALMSKDDFLIKKVKDTLITLIEYQNKHGQIPSNVDIESRKVSFGGSAGRMDSNLWFLICFGQYIRRTKDKKFLRKYYKRFKKSIELSHLYELNDKGFIYVPKGGDWADEFIMEGYVLYDQLLYYQSIKEYIFIRRKLKKNCKLQEKQLAELKKRILVNFWPELKNKKSNFVYHNILFDKVLSQKKYQKSYLLPYFNPSGYGYRFDGMANSLALLFGILEGEKKRTLLDFIYKNFSKKTRYLIPSFYPVISRKNYDWRELRNNYSFKFKNKPHEYHNGGLWPLITGFFVAGLSENKEKKVYLEGINFANHLEKLENPGFYEYLNGKTFKPNGTKKMAWNAASAVIAYNCLKGDKLLL